MPNIDPTPEKPTPRWWREPITLEQFQEYTPEKFELVDGYLFDGKDSPDNRLKLLRILLTNCGLEAAASMCDRDDWLRAGERAYSDFYEDILDQALMNDLEGVQVDDWDGEKWVPAQRGRPQETRADAQAIERIVHLTINM